jgi:hypothetical protein
MAAPSSALASAEGMKKVTNSTTSQVNVSPPPTAIAPMVSTTTMAEMRKKIVSCRPSTRLSFLRSAAASAAGCAVITARTSSAAIADSFETPADA